METPPTEKPKPQVETLASPKKSPQTPSQTYQTFPDATASTTAKRPNRTLGGSSRSAKPQHALKSAPFPRGFGPRAKTPETPKTEEV